MADQQDVRLKVEIKNQQPIELLELTKSLVALGNQFTKYVSEHGDSKEAREAKLYIKEIRTGSVILDLVETASIGMIPFIENLQTITGFAKHLKTLYDIFLAKKKTPLPQSLTTNDYKDLSQILNPIAADSASQMNISATVNGNVELHFHIDSLEANALQNVIGKEIKSIKVPETGDGIETKVLLRLYQARADSKENKGNKGIIEELTPKPINLIFEDDAIKNTILQGEHNPFKTVYVVDVKQQYVQEKIAAYRVVKYHEMFDLEE